MIVSRDPIYSLYMIDLSPFKATDVMVDVYTDVLFSGSAYECISKSELIHLFHGTAFLSFKNPVRSNKERFLVDMDRTHHQMCI